MSLNKIIRLKIVRLVFMAVLAGVLAVSAFAWEVTFYYEGCQGYVDIVCPDNCNSALLYCPDPSDCSQCTYYCEDCE